MRKYDIQIESIRSFYKSTDFLEAVSTHCNYLSEYMPEKWGWYEPLKCSFDPNNIYALLEKERPSNVWWKRLSPHKAEGSWLTRWESTVEDVGNTHASVCLTIYEDMLQDKVCEYLQKISSLTEADISFIDGIHPNYQNLADQNNWSLFGGNDLRLTTHTLRHWLPDMPWGIVLGPAYIRLFGKNRVMKTPAYKVEELGKEMVYIQLTPKMKDIHSEYEMVMSARISAKQHLGEEHFFRKNLAYDSQEHPEKAGKVFKVPEFKLAP